MKPTVTKIIRKDGRNAYAYLSDGRIIDVWYRCFDKKYILHSFLSPEKKSLDEIASFTPFTSVG